MKSHPASGLSAENRTLITSALFGALLLFGPVQPGGLAVRIAYLIAIPSITWVALRAWGQKMNIGSATNDRIRRAVVAGIAGALLVAGYQAYTASHHLECDQFARTADGRECVGDYVKTKGGDVEGALVWALLAGFAFWYAIRRTD